MPKVQTYDSPTVSARPLQIPQQRLDSRGAFGESLAGAVSDVAGVFEQIQDEQDITVAREGLTRYRNETRDSMTGYLAQKGKNAYEQRGTVGEQINKVASSISEGMSERQRKLYERLVESHKSADLDRVASHASAGFREWRTTTVLSSIDSIQQDIAVYHNDSDDYIASLKGEVANLARLEGWDDSVREAETTKRLTAAHMNAIDNILAQHGDAQAYYDKHMNDILPSMRDDVTGKIQRANEGMVAQSVADVAAIAPTITEARRIVREKIKDNPGARKAAMALVAEEFRVREWEERSTQADVVNEIDLHRRAGGSVAAWAINNRERWELLTPAQRASMERTGAIETDWQAYSQVESLIESGDIESEAQIRAYGGQINAKQVNTLVKEWKKRGQVSNAELRRLYTDYTGKPLGTPSKPLEGNAAKEWNAFKDYITSHLEETRRPEDLPKWAARWAMTGENTESSMWVTGDDPETYGEAVATGYADTFEMDLPDDIDPMDVDEVISAAGIGGGNSKQNYWNHYVPASDWLEAHDMPLSQGNIAAVLLLKQNGKKVTPESVAYVFERLK